MSMILLLLKCFMYATGLIGIAANILLVIVIHKRTPPEMRIYSMILRTSAVCDSFGLACMTATMTRLVCMEQSSILEFYGFCADYGVESCWLAFATQECMFSATILLLVFSFTFRLRAVNNTNLSRNFVIRILPLLIIVNTHLIPGYYTVISSAQTTHIDFVERYRNQRTEDVPEALGLAYITDPLDLFCTGYTQLTALSSFLVMRRLKTRTLEKYKELEFKISANAKSQHAMLSKALNIQLAVSALFFAGCSFYTLNLLQFEGIPTIETAFMAIPIINMQNACTPIVNLYCIKPYRKYVTQIFKKDNAIMVSAPSTVASSSTAPISQYESEA